MWGSPRWKMLAFKLLRVGYYWPTMRKDALHIVQRCNKCQKLANIPHTLPTPMVPMQGPQPFAQWRIDLIGPIPLTPGKIKHVVVAIDYFTKWGVTEPLASITTNSIINFVRENIVCRFGVPRVIVIDKGSQFDMHHSETFVASKAYPKVNGQVEVTNRTIKKSLKKHLRVAKCSWLEELPDVLWAYRTTPRAGTGETSFFLAFGAEVVIPIELEIPNYQTTDFNQQDNEILPLRRTRPP